MADINVLDLTPTTPGSNDSLILFDRTTGEGKSTRFDTLSGQVLDSKFGDSNPTAGQELSYDATTGKYKNTSQIASLNEALTNKTNDIISTMSANGAHNLLPNTLKSQVRNGVTYTVNSDGSIYANGTATGTDGSLVLVGSITLDAGNYIISGGIINWSKELILASSGMPNIRVGGDEITFVVDTTRVYDVYLHVVSGITISNETFYPMIRLATDSDSTFRPYAKTNRELTEEHLVLSTITQSIVGNWTSTNGTIIKKDIILVKHSNEAHDVEMPLLELRLSDVDAGVNPTIKFTCDELTKFPEFYISIPSGVRRATSSSAIDSVPTDGGRISHADGSNTATISLNDYITSKPGGYLHLLK